VDPSLCASTISRCPLFGNPEKAVVDVVLPDSPAAKAEIKSGDVILKVDATTFTGFASFADYIRSKKPGQTVKLVVKRGDQEIGINVMLGKRPIGN